MFYDEPANKRIVDVHNNPSQATILRKDTAANSDLTGSRPQAHGSMAGTDKWRRASKRATRNAVLHDSEAMQRVREAEETKLTMALKHVFEEYNRWEGGVNRSRMDKPRFHKVFRCRASSADGAWDLSFSVQCAWNTAV